jgi:protein-tyrosine phosphatase
MAEGVLRKLLQDSGLSKEVTVDSVATHDYRTGSAPAEEARRLAKSRGYDIDHLVARHIKPGDFDDFDLILVMDQSNLRALSTIAPTNAKRKIELLTEYSDKYHGRDIPDPYGGKPKHYEVVLDMVEESCSGLIEALRSTLRKRSHPQ